MVRGGGATDAQQSHGDPVITILTAQLAVDSADNE